MLEKIFITASKPIGYSYYESEIRIPSTSKEIQKDIYLEWRDNCLPNDLGCLLDINPIFFDLDKHYITYRASKELKKILTVMFKHPKINISIESHTDSRGSNSYNEALSDRRAKENILTVDNALDKVSELRGVYYNKKDSDEKKREVGVIAQEVKEVLPEVVTYDKENDQYGVDYGKINGLLIEAIKDLKKEVEELKQCKKCTDCDCNN